VPPETAAALQRYNFVGCTLQAIRVEFFHNRGLRSC
jgi:hypothetical protein